MLFNHFKIAWRNLVRDRQYSLLNLFGLSTGLACVILIYLWVSDELRVDKFLKNDDRIYQVMQNFPDATGNTMTSDHTQAILAGAMKKDLPEVEEAVILRSPGEDEEPNGIMTLGDTHIKAREIYVSQNFFSVFSYNLVQGNRAQPLPGRNDILISEDLAQRVFHTTKNIIGKTISWDRGATYSAKLNGNYIVKGVFQSPPDYATLQFDVVFNWDHYMDLYKKQYGLENWSSSNPYTFVLLKKGTDPIAFNKKINQFIRNKWKLINGENDLKYIGTIFAQRYSEKYFHNKYENGQITGGRVEYVRLFSIIAIFILVIACINFMNLATAKASRRMKEVGVRKVIGARRGSLILQYISESLLMAALSTIIALLLASLLLPAFKSLTGKELLLHLDLKMIAALVGITIITGLFAGSYPAFYLSHFKPGLILKGSARIFKGESWIRRGLVVFQFAISVVLIISVLVVYQQMKLIQTKNLGYSKDNIITFSNEGPLQRNLNNFLIEVRKIPSVKYATDVEGDFVGNHSGGGGIGWPGKDHPVEFSGFYADDQFIETMGLTMKEGRGFSKEFGSDSTSVIFNESAIAAMGLKDPVGQEVDLWSVKKKIIGVVNDFHFESLYKKVGPFFISYQKNNTRVMVKMKSGSETQAIPQIEKLYKSFAQGLPLEYRFMDEEYQQMYQSEQKVAVLSKWFAGMAVLISCLGLFGLAAFTAQKREKEIGIRKVIGATVSNITVLLSRDFLKLVVISICIAFPIAWWATNRWLDSFAYRIHPGWGLFAGSAISVILITLATVSYQSIKAALANPVSSLRSE